MSGVSTLSHSSDDAGVEHIGERALGDDEVLRLIAVFRDDNGEPAAKEVIRDFVDLGEAVRRYARALPAATMAASSGFSMPVSNAALRKVESGGLHQKADLPHPRHH